MRLKHWLPFVFVLGASLCASQSHACSGYSENGYCYILGAPGQSCTAACQPFGGCAAKETDAIALQHTADNQTCNNALAQLLKLQQPVSPYEFVNPRGIVGGGLGCFAFKAGAVYYGVRNVIPTTCNRGYGTAQRVCACNK